MKSLPRFLAEARLAACTLLAALPAAHANRTWDVNVHFNTDVGVVLAAARDAGPQAYGIATPQGDNQPPSMSEETRRAQPHTARYLVRPEARPS